MKSCIFDPRVLGYESLSLKPRTSHLQTGFVESSNSRDLIFGLSFYLERKIFGLVTQFVLRFTVQFCKCGSANSSWTLGPGDSWFYFLNDELVWDSLKVFLMGILWNWNMSPSAPCVVLLGFLKKNQGCHYKNMKEEEQRDLWENLKYGF